jgi:hypothetical protein
MEWENGLQVCPTSKAAVNETPADKPTVNCDSNS